MLEKCLLLSESDIEECLSIEDAILLSERTLREQGENRVLMPPKLRLNMREAGIASYMNAAPAFIGFLGVAGIKWGGGFSANSKAGDLPYMVQTVILNDPTNGAQKAILSGTRITAAKTGCESAVACKYLASRQASVAAIVGVGGQGTGNLVALLALCKMGILKLREIRLFDIVSAKSADAAKCVASQFVRVVACRTAEDAIRDADIIITATTATEPFLKKAWIKRGAFIVALGGHQELEDEILVTADKFVVDDWEENIDRGQFCALIKSGRLKNEDCEKLPEIVCGKARGRESDDQIIIGSLIGLGSIDVCIAHLIYERAKEKGLGQTFEFMAGTY